LSAILVIGRILFGGFFVLSGINHFAKLEMMTGYAKYKKLPAAKLGVILSGLMLVVGGAYVVLGFYADLGALLLAIFLILAAIIFHNFWVEKDATAKQNEMLAFMKDIALAGAALVLFALIAKHGDLGFGWVASKGHLAFFK
jgi:putative oxidoreductase